MNLAPTSVDFFWKRYRRPILATAIVFMAALALLRLGKEIPRYFSPTDEIGAYDLDNFYLSTRAWTQSDEIYGHVPGAVYPPATYVMLWPVMAWLSLDSVRLLWFAMMVAGIAAFIWIMIRECRPPDRVATLFLALIPLAGYPVGTTFLVGQLSIHVLFLLALAMLRLDRSPRGWGHDAITAALLLAALVKPTTAAPFFWLAVFLPGRLRVAAMTASGYAVLAAVAGLIRHESVQGSHRDWVGTSQSWTVNIDGHVHLHRLMAWIGLADERLIGSLLVLALFGAWVFFHRRASIWTLLGVTAIVSRIWVYHRLYDDIMLYFAMIALWRMASTAPSRGANPLLPALLFSANLLCLLAPSNLLRWDSPVAAIMEAGIAAAWLGSLVYLGVVAFRQRRESPNLEQNAFLETGRKSSG